MSIVVVGHGISPKGRGWGKSIDAFDSVIRMWDHDWQNEDDYGSKYDYGFLEILPGDFSKVFWHTNKRLPAKHFVAYERTKTPQFRIPRGTVIVDQRWRDVAWSMGGRGVGGKQLNLTRGCAAACWAITSLAKRGEQIMLVGFDNMVKQLCLPVEKAFPQEYLDHYDKLYPRWRKNWYTPNMTTCGTHDIAIELPLVRSLAKTYGVDLQFNFEALEYADAV